MSKKFNTQIEMLAPAVQPNHVTTLKQVEEMISGKVKSPVRVASTTNMVGTYDSEAKTLTATANAALVIDGVTLTAGDRVLLAGQTDKTQNGIFDVTDAGSAGTPFKLTRSSDFDTSPDIFPGVRIAVTEGSSNKDTMWQLSTDAPIVLDSTSLEFTLDTGLGSGVVQNTFEIAGDATTTEYTFSHNWDTKDVTYDIYNKATGESEVFDFKRLNMNDVQVSCAVPLGVGNDYVLILQAEV